MNRHRATTWAALAGLWLGWGIGVATAQDAQTFDLAVTVDDLPWSGPTPGHASLMAANGRMLDALATRTVPAVGFVVCDAARDVRVVRAWLDAGHGLGNHTAAHRGLNDTDPDVWLRDVERCHAFLRDLTAPVYFRYPMLQAGRPAQLRDAMAEAVRRMGYRRAPVTVDNSEWVLAAQYRTAAAQGDSAAMRALGIAYVGHVRRATHHARTIAKARFGRDVRHVLLLHANLLNADWLGALLDSLAADGARFVALDHALADSVYALPDDYAGAQGLSWLYRVRPAQPALALWDEEEEHVLRTTVEHNGVAPAVLREIAARSRAFSATYLARDPARVRSFYTDDAVLVMPGGKVITGGMAIERYWTLGPRLRALEHRLRPERMYGDATRIVELGRWFSTSQRDGAEPTSAAGRYVVEWVRGSDAQWRMRLDTWHRDDGEAR